MKNADFIARREEHTAARFDLCDRKAKDYTDGVNRHDNFERLGAEFDVHPLKVLGIYMHKHWDSIVRYIRTEGQATYSEDIQGRIYDLQNYGDLFITLVEDFERAKRPEFRPGDNY